ncbi:MAG: hypothetical protein ACRD5K_00715 [Candidatus Acidiferrales bacterium]
MSRIAHPKVKKKHPRDMTTDEAMWHLFTRRGRKVIKKHVAEVEKKSSTGMEQQECLVESSI